MWGKSSMWSPVLRQHVSKDCLQVSLGLGHRPRSAQSFHTISYPLQHSLGFLHAQQMLLRPLERLKDAEQIVSAHIVIATLS